MLLGGVACEVFCFCWFDSGLRFACCFLWFVRCIWFGLDVVIYVGVYLVAWLCLIVCLVLVN